MPGLNITGIIRLTAIFSLLFLTSCTFNRGKHERKIPLVVYHYEDSQVAYGITESYERGKFIISGWTSEGNRHPPHCLLMKVDREGNILERKIYDELEGHCGFIVKSPEDGGYFVENGKYLVKLDGNLNYRWRRVFQSFTFLNIVDQFARIDSGRYVYALAKGTYVRAVMLDNEGNILRTTDMRYREGVLTFSSVVEALEDGSIVIAAEYRDTITDTSGIYIAKLNPRLDTVWTRVIDLRSMYGYPVAKVMFLTHLNDGSLIAGVLILRRTMNGFGAILKLDSLGNVISEFNFDGDGDAISIINSAARLSVGGFVVEAKILGVGIFYTTFIRFDDNLNIVWRRDFTDSEMGSSISYGQVIETSDGDLAFTGYYPITDDIAFMMLDRETGEPLIWSTPDW